MVCGGLPSRIAGAGCGPRAVRQLESGIVEPTGGHYTVRSDARVRARV